MGVSPIKVIYDTHALKADNYFEPAIFKTLRPVKIEECFYKIPISAHDKYLSDFELAVFNSVNCGMRGLVGIYGTAKPHTTSVIRYKKNDSSRIDYGKAFKVVGVIAERLDSIANVNVTYAKIEIMDNPYGEQLKELLSNDDIKVALSIIGGWEVLPVMPPNVSKIYVVKDISYFTIDT